MRPRHPEDGRPADDVLPFGAPAPDMLDGLASGTALSVVALRGRISGLLTRLRTALLSGTRVAVSAVRGHLTFNRIMQVVLAAPLLAGTPTLTAFDEFRVPLPNAAPLPDVKTVRSVPAGVEAPAPAAVSPGAPEVDAVPLTEADLASGPRVRTTCSREGRTVFLDDRRADAATESWKEDVHLSHPGSVCAFAPRVGVADPNFRRIDIKPPPPPSPSSPPSEVAVSEVPYAPPPSSSVASLPAPPFAPAARAAVDGAPPQDRVGRALDADDLQQALAALAAAPVGAAERPRAAESAARSAPWPSNPGRDVRQAVPLPSPRPAFLEDRQTGRTSTIFSDRFFFDPADLVALTFFTARFDVAWSRTAEALAFRKALPVPAWPSPRAVSVPDVVSTGHAPEHRADPFGVLSSPPGVDLPTWLLGSAVLHGMRHGPQTVGVPAGEAR